MTDDGVVTWRTLWSETTAALGDRNHARWMCEIASGCDGADFVAELDKPATQSMVAHLDALIARRITGEPLQYVLGRWQFRRLDLMIDPRVLIPRPETEWVCELAIERARFLLPTLIATSPTTLTEPLQVADLGTGSGAIGLSIAAEMRLGSVAVWLADVSQDALDVASANLAGIGRNAQMVRVVQGSWFDALPHALRGRLDLVVANPPYVAVDDPALEATVLQWEPHLALFGGADGLDDLRIIIADAAHWLRAGGFLVVEIGADQGGAVLDLLRAADLRDAAIHKDLAGRDRVAVAHR
jgi:release factor glutamine methyltransferase